MLPRFIGMFGGQKMLDSVDMELQEVVNKMWMLGFEQ